MDDLTTPLVIDDDPVDANVLYVPGSMTHELFLVRDTTLDASGRPILHVDVWDGGTQTYIPHSIIPLDEDPSA